MKMLVGILIGAVAGYAWYAVVGCSTGACPITSNPYTSMLYGAALGALFAAG